MGSSFVRDCAHMAFVTALERSLRDLMGIVKGSPCSMVSNSPAQ